MMELIDRQSVRLLESDSDAYAEDWNNDYEKGFCDAINKVLKLPTIKAEPVRYGHWIQRRNLEYYCSNCGREEKHIFQKNYCPRCGSKMHFRSPTEAQLDEADSVIMGGAENA